MSDPVGEHGNVGDTISWVSERRKVLESRNMKMVIIAYRKSVE